MAIRNAIKQLDFEAAHHLIRTKRPSDRACGGTRSKVWGIHKKTLCSGETFFVAQMEVKWQKKSPLHWIF